MGSPGQVSRTLGSQDRSEHRQSSWKKKDAGEERGGEEAAEAREPEKGLCLHTSCNMNEDREKEAIWSRLQPKWSCFLTPPMGLPHLGARHP